jgi:hypothetical protein
MKYKTPHQTDYNLDGDGSSKINETCRANGIFCHKNMADKGTVKYILYLKMIILNINL